MHTPLGSHVLIIATAPQIGVYFARDAAYSAQPQYATAGSDGYCRMLSCRVLHGIYCKGTDNGLTPDVYDATTNRLYDSTVNDIVDPIMWITYHDSQVTTVFSPHSIHRPRMIRD